MDELCRLDFDPEKLKLSPVFMNGKLQDYTDTPVDGPKIASMYGALRFPEMLPDRPYVFGAFVTSVDGCIVFEDNTEGPLVAQANKADPDGGLADFWILNLLRAACDGTIGGAPVDHAASATEEQFGVCLEGGGHLYDRELEEYRVQSGRGRVPVNIITSLDGTDLSFDHPLLSGQSVVPVIMTTSPNGLRQIQTHLNSPYRVIRSEEDINKGDGIPVIVTGQGSMPDARRSMQLLKGLGMHRVLVETPTYCHHLMTLELLDELFVNQSGVYIGGNAMTLGRRGQSFPSTDHPHTELMSLHLHSPHFIYLRYRMIYGQQPHDQQRTGSGKEGEPCNNLL